jgi:hypothetical protein
VYYFALSLRLDITFSGYLALILVCAGVFGFAVYCFRILAFNDPFHAVRQAIPDVRTLDQFAVQIARSGVHNRLIRRALEDRNPQVRYVAAITVEVGQRIVSSEKLLDALLSANSAWLRPVPHLLNALVRDRGQDKPILDWLSNYVMAGTDGEALYGLEAIAAVKRFERGLEYSLGGGNLWSNLSSRPLHVVAHAICLWHLEYSPKPRSAREAFVFSFAEGLKQRPSEGKGGRLAALFHAQTDYSSTDDSSTYDAKQVRASLEGVSPERMDDLVQLFGPGDEQSLGYYDDLRNASLYKDVYAFLFRIRLALAEVDYSGTTNG